MATKAGAGAAPDNRQLPSKEAALFRQLAKQYEVNGMRAAAHGPRRAAAGAPAAAGMH